MTGSGSDHPAYLISTIGLRPYLHVPCAADNSSGDDRLSDANLSARNRRSWAACNEATLSSYPPRAASCFRECPFLPRGKRRPNHVRADRGRDGKVSIQTIPAALWLLALRDWCWAWSGDFRCGWHPGASGGASRIAVSASMPFLTAWRRSRGWLSGRGRRSRSGGARRSSAGSSRGVGRVRADWRRAGSEGRSGTAGHRLPGSSGIPAGACRASAGLSRRGTRRTSCRPTGTAERDRRRSAAISPPRDGRQPLRAGLVRRVQIGSLQISQMTHHPVGWARPTHTAALVDRLVKRAPRPQLQALISSVAAGCGLYLYIPN